MSQGGNNEVARLNVALTGDVAPLAAAAKQAEQVVQQSAAKIEAVAAATSQSVQGMGSGIGAGLAGSGIGGIGMPGGGGGAGSSGPSGFFGLVRGAKESIAPLNMAISLVTRLLGVFGLVAGAGYAITQMLTSQSRAAAASKKEVEELRTSLDGLFTTKPQTGVPAEIREREELFAAVEKQRKFDSDSFARYRAGVISRGQLNSLEAASKKKLEEELANIRAKFTAEKNKAETDSQIDYDKKQEELRRKRVQGEKEVATASANAVGGVLGAYAEADAEAMLARETLKGDELNLRLEVIDIELRTKIAAIDKEEDEARKSYKRQMDDRRNQLQDFYRTVRGDQVSGFAVEGFQTSNLSQSLDLLARQRGGVDGPKQLRVDYGGTR